MLRTLKDLFFPPAALSLAVIFAEYNRPEHGGSDLAFTQLQELLSSLAGIPTTYLRVDNREEGTPLRQEEAHLYRLGGDNRYREFSGWQKGVETIAQLHLPFDLVLFVNDMFRKPGESFLKDYATETTLERVRQENIVLGRIDSTGQQYTALGHDIHHWICTNCFLLPWPALTRIGSLVTVGDNLDDFLPSTYPPGHQLGQYPLTIAASARGHFTITLPLAGQESFDLRLSADRSHPRSNARHPQAPPDEASFLLDAVEINGQPLAAEHFLYGRLADEQYPWHRANTLLHIPEQNAPRLLTLRGTIPPNILHDHYDDQATITLYNDTLIFSPEAPLNLAYQRWLVEWLTSRWHSRFQIAPATWDLFRTKVRNILNEALLTARLAKAGYPAASYGEKWYY